MYDIGLHAYYRGDLIISYITMTPCKSMDLNQVSVFLMLAIINGCKEKVEYWWEWKKKSSLEIMILLLFPTERILDFWYEVERFHLSGTE